MLTVASGMALGKGARERKKALGIQILEDFRFLPSLKSLSCHHYLAQLLLG